MSGDDYDLSAYQAWTKACFLAGSAPRPQHASVRDRLATQHSQLMGSVSPIALAAALRREAC